jgi:hypothetical protein
MENHQETAVIGGLDMLSCQLLPAGCPPTCACCLDPVIVSLDEVCHLGTVVEAVEQDGIHQRVYPRHLCVGLGSIEYIAVCICQPKHGLLLL